jgi:hypothetical protein
MNEAPPNAGPAPDHVTTPPAPSTLEQYRAMVNTLAAALRDAGRACRTANLERLTEALEHADAVGPLLDPTRYRAAAQNGQLEMQRELFAWARETTRTAERLQTLALGFLRQAERAFQLEADLERLAGTERDEAARGD